jgi:hypothetical protein
VISSGYLISINGYKIENDRTAPTLIAVGNLVAASGIAASGEPEKVCYPSPWWSGEYMTIHLMEYSSRQQSATNLKNKKPTMMRVFFRPNPHRKIFTVGVISL